MAYYGYPCTGCGSRDCDGCEDDRECEARELHRDEPCREFPAALEVEEAEEAHAATVHELTGVWEEWGVIIPSLSSRLNMIRMVKDAGENGDRPWPYGRVA